jgi:hypothetical protein
MEMQQTHYYTTGTATLPWKCNMVHRSCYQGKPNMSQYLIYKHTALATSVAYFTGKGRCGRNVMMMMMMMITLSVVQGVYKL